MPDTAPPPPDLDDESTQARVRRMALARETAVADAERVRIESEQRHTTTRGQIDELRREVATLTASVGALREEIAGKGGMREAMDRMRGALWLGAILAGLVGTGVSWLVLTTIETRQTTAVHSVEIAGLHAEDDASKTERRELRDAVTRAAAAVERVAGSVEAVGERVDRVEDEVREQRTRGR